MFFDASDRTSPRLSYSELDHLLTTLAAKGDTDSLLYRKLYNARAAHLTRGNNVSSFDGYRAVRRAHNG